jgi:phi LC3 family holin
MNINWKLRFKNTATITALAAAIVAFVYQILGIVGVTAPISQDNIMQAVGLVINVLVALGILVDPTTDGIADSAQAQGYVEPKKEG